MNNKNSLDERILDFFKNEADEVSFSKKSREKISIEINKKNTFLKRFLERELEIPISPVLAVTIIFISLWIYTLYPFIKTTEKDIIENRTVILYLNGGYPDED